MEQAIEHGADGGNIAEQFAPVLDGTVGSEQRAEALVAAHDDLQQILGGGVRKLAHAEVVDDEQRHRRHRFHVFLARAIGNGVGQFIQQHVRFAIQHVASLVEWRLARWPAPGGFCPFRPSQKHNAHGPENINIHYRFHPLYGQRLRVERRAKLASGEYIFCELPDGTIGGFPSWITDPATNANVSVGAPLTSAAALAELRTLLDSLHSNSPRGDASLLKIRREGTNDTKENAGEDPDEPTAL